MKLFITTLVALVMFSCANLKENQPLNSDSSTADYMERFSEGDDNFFPARSIKIYPKSSYRKVSGVCIIDLSNDSGSDYCNDITLGLRDKNLKIVVQAQTDNVGRFTFESAPLGLHELVVLNTAYSKYSQKIFVRPGAEVLIHLKKNK